MASKAEIEKFIDKVSASKAGKLDLSSDEDLSIAIMNLISIEEHFYFTGAKTGKTKYYNLLNEVREMRKELLKKIIKDYEGEVWCISKHLLSSSMRLIEVGTKYYNKKDKKTALEMYEKAYNLYSLFWGINLGAVDMKGVEKVNETQLDTNDKSKKGVFAKLGSLVKYAIDCCKE